MTVSDKISLASLAVAIISLVFALIAYWQARRSRQLQNKVNELDIAIKEIELQQAIDNNKQKSDLDANVDSIGAGQYNLVVKNVGNVDVFDVDIYTNKSQSHIDVLDRGLPFKKLERKKGFSVMLVVDVQSSHAFEVTMNWREANGKMQEKIQCLNL